MGRTEHESEAKTLVRASAQIECVQGDNSSDSGTLSTFHKQYEEDLAIAVSPG